MVIPLKNNEPGNSLKIIRKYSAVQRPCRLPESPKKTLNFQLNNLSNYMKYKEK